MINPALVRISMQDSTRPSLVSLGAVYDVFAQLCRYEIRVENLIQAAQSSIKHPLNRLGKSVKAISGAGTRIVASISNLFAQSAEIVRDTIGIADLQEVDHRWVHLSYMFTVAANVTL